MVSAARSRHLSPSPRATILRSVVSTAAALASPTTVDETVGAALTTVGETVTFVFERPLPLGVQGFSLRAEGPVHGGAEGIFGHELREQQAP